MAEEKKGSSKILPVLIVLVVIAIIIVLLLRGCAKETPQAETAKLETSPKPLASEKVGHLHVEGNSEFQVAVYQGEGAARKEIVAGSCKIDLPLKPDQYSVMVKPKDKFIPLGVVTIEAEKVSKLVFNGFGVLFVDCAVFQAPYDVVSDGQKIAGGEAKVSKVGLAVGKYQVRMRIAGLDIRKDVEIKPNETSKVVFDEIGILFVKCPVFDAKYEVLKEGEVVARGGAHTAKPTLAVGKYQVRMKIAGLDIKKDVEIKPNQTSEISIKDFGQLEVRGPAFGRKYEVQTMDGKKVASGTLHVVKIPLPTGDYKIVLPLGGRTLVTPVTVKGEGQVLDLKNHGLISVKSPTFGVKFFVKDETGKQIASGSSQVGEVPVPNGTYTVHCEGMQLPATINGKHVKLVFKKK